MRYLQRGRSGLVQRPPVGCSLMPIFLLGVLVLKAVLSSPSIPTSATMSLCSARDKCLPFSGDVYPKSGLVASLAARSWKKEIVILGETRMAPAYQAFDDFRRLNIGHVLWLTDKAEKCTRSIGQLPELACGWSTQAWPDVLGMMHMIRMSYLARAVRLGYNVLLVDADIIMFHDPYKFLKQPPLSEINTLVMRDGNGLVNAGVVYMQNVRPDGPSAYLASEVVDRPLRWLENGTMLAKAGRVANCWEQSLYTDAVLSTVAGRPIFYSCFPPYNTTQQPLWAEAHQKQLGVNGQKLSEAPYLTRTELGWPESLSVLGAGTPKYTDFRSGTIRVPNVGQQGWPEELGGVVFDAARGPLSQRWMDVLLADASPLWPDPENPSMAGHAALRTERFAFLPGWFVQTWSDGGTKGWWLDGVVGPVHPQVMAHFVHVPGGGSSKPIVKMASGHWNWTLHHLAKRESGTLFHASSRTNPVPRLLGYGPSVENHEWTSEAEFAMAVQQLALLATMTNRTAIFPSFSCSVPWYGSGARMVAPPYEVNPGHAIMYGAAPGMRCMWVGYLPFTCQEPKLWGGGLLPLEYAHYLSLKNTSVITELSVQAALARYPTVKDPKHAAYPSGTADVTPKTPATPASGVSGTISSRRVANKQHMVSSASDKQQEALLAAATTSTPASPVAGASKRAAIPRPVPKHAISTTIATPVAEAVTAGSVSKQPGSVTTAAGIPVDTAGAPLLKALFEMGRDLEEYAAAKHAAASSQRLLSYTSKLRHQVQEKEQQAMRHKSRMLQGVLDRQASRHGHVRLSDGVAMTSRLDVPATSLAAAIAAMGDSDVVLIGSAGFQLSGVPEQALEVLHNLQHRDRCFAATERRGTARSHWTA